MKLFKITITFLIGLPFMALGFAVEFIGSAFTIGVDLAQEWLGGMR